MSSIELFLIAIGLSMDAFAVAVCKGLSMRKIKLKNAFIISLLFGFFQAFMPAIGYALGSHFEVYIREIDHWIAFIILGMIGLNMINEARKDETISNDINEEEDLNLLNIFILAIATSIDALAVGISLAFLKVDILYSIVNIGVVTFICSFFGVCIGHVFGKQYKNKAEFVGGLILIGIGTKILFEHLGF